MVEILPVVFVPASHSVNIWYWIPHLSLFLDCFSYFLYSFLSFYRTDMIWESSWQFPLPCKSLPGMSALHSTARHSFFWVSTLIPSCPLFVFWVNGQQDRVWSAVRTSCCCALQIKRGKQHCHTIDAHSRHSSTPIYTSGHRSAHSNVAWCLCCTVEHTQVIFPCEPVALNQFVCCASEQPKKCVHVHL